MILEIISLFFFLKKINLIVPITASGLQGE